MGLNQFERSPAINAIEGIYNKSFKHFSNAELDSNKKNNPFDPGLTHNNLFSLVISKDLLRLSYRKLRIHKGAMTPGSGGSTADSISESEIEKLHQSLKNKTFTWSPVKRINIQKPRRAPGVTRPLGIPDFADKLVQKNIL